MQLQKQARKRNAVRSAPMKTPIKSFNPCLPPGISRAMVTIEPSRGQFQHITEHRIIQ